VRHVAELPEVETMRRDLAREIVGLRILGVRVAQTRMLGRQDAETLRSRVEHRFVAAIGRRGKFLLLRLATGGGNVAAARNGFPTFNSPWAVEGDAIDRPILAPNGACQGCPEDGDALLIHRGMTGNLFLKQPSDPPDAHLHLALLLDDGRELRLCDHRGFGEVRWVSGEEIAALCARLGPEPLGPAFTAKYLAGQLARRSALVKALLLNQSVVAGLGNIYVDEALWAAMVHPARRANTLSEAEAASIRDAIVRLVRESIDCRGTTFRDYKDLYGRPGGNSRHLQVFHRAKEPCPRCGEPIQLVRAAGRGSSVCLACQSPPTG